MTQTKRARGSAAPRRSSFFVLSVCPQGFISGFALIPPWALQEYRAYGTHVSTTQQIRQQVQQQV